eukprot:7902846-Pyramimonas_sp.AAC.1
MHQGMALGFSRVRQQRWVPPRKPSRLYGTPTCTSLAFRASPAARHAHGHTITQPHRCTSTHTMNTFMSLRLTGQTD